jgi:hypothetical protein
VLVDGGIIFGLVLGREVMYRCVSHSTLVTKSCGGVWRNGVRLGRSMWDNAFHSHCNLLVVIVAMYLPCWSYIWDYVSCICMVCLC